MSQYKPYPAYKDSGVEWLGRVPEHWEARPLWAVASCNDDVISDGTDEDFEFDYIDISSVSLDKGVNETTRLRFADAPSRARRLVKRGDIIISTVRTYLRALAVIDGDHEGCVASTGFAVVRSLGEVSTKFLGWALLSDIFISAVEARSQGVSYPAINATDLVKLKLPVPQLDEQKTIAAFLDRETARIDALIQKKQRLIELLKEKRQAVITQAVTKGLDPNVPMKDSGVEWLGEVPAHWDVLHVNRLYEDYDYGISSSLGDEGDVAVLRMGNMKDGAIHLDNLAYVADAPSELLLKPGDLLFNRTNSIDLVGRVGIFGGASFPVSFASYLVRLNLRYNVEAEYVNFLLNLPVILAVAQSIAIPAIGQANLSPSRYGDTYICLPPTEEQRDIVLRLYEFLKPTTDLLAKAEHSIALLTEHRSALITAAVTGQIDVRDAA